MPTRPGIAGDSGATVRVQAGCAATCEAEGADVIFKAVRDSKPYPDHKFSTRDWANVAPRPVRLDELTTTTTSTVWVVRDGAVTADTVDPVRLGIARADPADLVGGEVAFNVDVARRLFDGGLGPVRDAVMLNSAAAIAVHAGLSGDLEGDLAAGLLRAAEALDSGSCAEVLSRWVEVGSKLAG